MNIQKFTQKSVEAINNCEKLAYDYGNQEIEQEHLLVALLQQEEGRKVTALQNGVRASTLKCSWIHSKIFISNCCNVAINFSHYIFYQSQYVFLSKYIRIISVRFLLCKVYYKPGYVSLIYSYPQKSK